MRRMFIKSKLKHLHLWTFNFYIFNIGEYTHNFDNVFDGEVKFETFPLAVYTGLFVYSGW